TYPIKICRIIEGKKYYATGILSVKEGPGPTGSPVWQFGVAQAQSLIIGITPDLDADYPFKDKDVLVKILGHELEKSWDIASIEKDLLDADAPALPYNVEITIKRDSKEQVVWIQLVLVNHSHAIILNKTGQMFKVKPSDRKEDDDKKTITFTPSDLSQITVKNTDITRANKRILDILGMTPRTVIRGVMKDSPADKAGLKPGDIILSYADTSLPTVREVNEINKEAAEDGAEILISRDGKMLGVINIQPKKHKKQILLGINPSVEFEHTTVGFVRKNSLAEKNDIKKGDSIESVNGQKVSTWIEIFNQLRAAQKADKPVTIKLVAGKTIEMGKIGVSEFDPECYSVSAFGGSGYGLKVLKTDLIKRGPIDAIGWGVGEVMFVVGSSYQTLRSLLFGDVSPDNIMGPVGMGSAAVTLSRRGPVEFMYFMAIISASLAVINFLPFPVVDGGHAVFLLIEKVMGKPVPIRIQNISQLIGIAALLLAFVLITWNDIARLIRGMW
ncbi:MAG TPA: PDZ domain-containing protein, partial [Phycisphaerae bacterium]|nr:PDZ domain-containing protein [Phycisphaerae bacterium]